MNSLNKYLIASDSIRNYIKTFESLKLKSYLCPAKVWTVGYGTTILPSGERVKQGMIITKEDAEYFFKHDINKFGQIILNYVISEINQNQFDAMVSLVYNIGEGNFRTSSVLKYTNKCEFNLAGESFIKFNKARINGVLTVLKGLTIRRKKEAQIYLTPYVSDNQKLISFVDKLKAKSFTIIERKNNIFNYDMGSFNYII